MGCDIHCYAEVLDTKDGAWKKVGDVFDNLYYRAGEPTEPPDEYGYVWNASKHDRPVVWRNYDVFAMLADVRNGSGFAGVKTGKGFKPIADPRGLPDDVSPEIQEESDKWGVDGHSHSWLTLAELLAYDWHGQSTTHYGVVGPDEYQVFVEKGKPNEWSGGVGGSGVRMVSPEEMARLIAAGEVKLGGDRFSSSAIAKPVRAGHYSFRGE